MLSDLLYKFDRYLRVLLALSSPSAKSYTVKLHEFFTWMDNAQRPVTDPAKISRRDVEDFLEHIFYNGNGNATRRQKLISIQHFIRFLVYEGIIPRDFTNEIPKPKLHRKHVQKFTKAEIYRFFQECDITTEHGQRNIGILIMLSFCGLRNSEVIGLTINDIEDDGTYIEVHIPETLGKKKQSRSLYLWKSPSILIRELYLTRLGHGAGPNDPLFVSYRRGGHLIGNPLLHRDIDLLVKTLGKAAKIRKAKIHPHMFRATHCSDLRNIRGYDLPAIAERIGHKRIDTTDLYIPKRERIHKEYASLAAYWSEFPKLWAQPTKEV